MIWRRKLLMLVALAILVSLPVAALAQPSTNVASAKLYDTSGTLVGIATFRETGAGGVRIQVVAWGLSVGAHGIHIHATGACAPDFLASGSHFNPTDAQHPHHAGDLGNIIVSRSGFGKLVVSTNNVTLSPGLLSLDDADGSALIIHADPDDLHTHPTGNSGGRVACGVIAF